LIDAIVARAVPNSQTCKSGCIFPLLQEACNSSQVVTFCLAKNAYNLNVLQTAMGHYTSIMDHLQRTYINTSRVFPVTITLSPILPTPLPSPLPEFTLPTSIIVHMLSAVSNRPPTPQFNSTNTFDPFGISTPSFIPTTPTTEPFPTVQDVKPNALKGSSSFPHQVPTFDPSSEDFETNFDPFPRKEHDVVPATKIQDSFENPKPNFGHRRTPSGDVPQSNRVRALLQHRRSHSEDVQIETFDPFKLLPNNTTEVTQTRLPPPPQPQQHRGHLRSLSSNTTV